MRISDWSSDVCSSDLTEGRPQAGRRASDRKGRCRTAGDDAVDRQEQAGRQIEELRSSGRPLNAPPFVIPARARLHEHSPFGINRVHGRSEERRGGKEWVSESRSRWWGEHEKKKKK